ncbi:Signal recognition particle receptor protein FtsY (=alpha subunit) (TC 3.A.5.1.1) [Candidatus Phaeomarinobacter ectocarpi]|uniref:Signal recognition particle receptor FtsY n=1 Tax=Candidatus Phaeomarinibacter ectocarpi TaxID=1458461 RepID=X5MEY5_9HYPH|nr:Signal recognition particle receptor protein FtsY (=alpha subunit) (TC 3.A.5.1.1) [Candidatus Phaeomarinobacter ectocarpi]
MTSTPRIPRIIDLGANAPAQPDEPEKKGLFKRLREGLSRSTSSMTTGIASVFTKRKLDGTTIEELEDLLIQADLGVDTATAITDAVSDGRYDKEVDEAEVRAIVASEVAKVLEPVEAPLLLDGTHKPHIILVVGVNGAGKTTTIGKLAKKMSAAGKSVVLGAGDTFRAAAIDQLKIWGERIGAPVVAHNVGADSAGLAFDTITKAEEVGADIVMIDTAGRLQNKTELMSELEKVVRVIKKRNETAPHSVLLVLDATTGQNALNQVEVFTKAVGVTGLVMTKLDGTARGGILVAIAKKSGLPVHAIGVGEGEDDLQPFIASNFAQAIAGLDDTQTPTAALDASAEAAATSESTS